MGIEWIPTEATLSVKQEQRKFIFGKNYYFLVMFTVKVDSDRDVELYRKFVESEQFMARPEFNMPEMPSFEELLAGKKPEKKAPPKEEEKKIRGSFIIIKNVLVPKFVYDKYNESEKIQICYDSKDPEKIYIQ